MTSEELSNYYRLESLKREQKNLWELANNVRWLCRRVYNNALRSGRLIPLDFCERCGGRGKIGGHHEDYSKPFEVVWLCHSCHGLAHRRKKS